MENKNNINATRMFSDLIINKSSYEDFDPILFERMKLRFADTMGVISAGSHGVGVDMLLDMLTDLGGKEEATIANFGKKVPAMNAAMINTMQMRSNDFEPCHADNKTGEGKPAHIAGTLYPTAFAVGEREGASGKQVMAAVAAADDLACRLSEAMGFSTNNIFDSTGTVNGMAAVACAGKLAGLNAEQLHNAFGIGINMFNGTMASTLEHSWLFKYPMSNASRAGIFAVDLAKRGYTGIEDPIGGTRCFLDMWGCNPSLEKLVDDFGTRRYGEVLIKPFAGCCATHHAIKATLLATGGKAYRPEEVKEIRSHMLGSKVGIVGGLWKPGEASQPFASFSVQGTVCNAVLHGGVWPENETPEELAGPDFQAMLTKYRQCTDLEEGNMDYWARVEVELVDGTVLDSGPVNHVRPGLMTSSEPLSVEYVYNKFMRNMKFGGYIPMDRAETIWNMCMNFDQIENVADLMRLMAR